MNGMGVKTSLQRSMNMRAIKSTGTKPEIALSKALHARGIRFRKNVQEVVGRPDICIKKYKLAVFVDGAFWHGRNWVKAKHAIKSNQEFWYSKIERNIERDREVNEKLKEAGWTVIRYWSDHVMKDPESVAFKIANTINGIKKNKYARSTGP